MTILHSTTSSLALDDKAKNDSFENPGSPLTTLYHLVIDLG